MKFSIITVSYNSGQTIERTIKSVLAQSYQDFEYIIVDGASKDDTMKIVKSYEDKFGGRLHYISEPDKGIYDAMNKGIKMAKGEIVGIVNSDDWLDKDALLNVDQAAMLPDAMKKVYTGDIMYYYNDGSTQVIRYSQKDLAHYAKVWRLGLNHPATFVPHQLYDEYGLFDINIKLQADSDFIDRLFHNGVEFIFIEKVISNQSDGGASTSNLNKSLKDYRYILNKNVDSQVLHVFYYFKYWIAVQIKKHSPTFLLKAHRK